MKLNSLEAILSNKSSKRVGRGAGSGLGKTAGGGLESVLKMLHDIPPRGELTARIYYVYRYL